MAIAEGYRQIGRDFPGMGEHWIKIGLVFDGRHEPTSPEFLSYVTVAGEPKLVGVAYAVPLLPGESPPAWPWAEVTWHDHARTVDEETLLPHGGKPAHHEHARAHHAAGDAPAEEPRLAMAHAWVWLRNPEGDFVSDNWALPYFRLGLTPADGAPVACARALTLLTGGAEYMTEVVAAAGGSPSEQNVLERALNRAQRAVRAILGRRSGLSLGEAELRELANTWARLWNDLDRTLGASSQARLAALR